MGRDEWVEADISKHKLLCKEDSQGCWSKEVEERVKNAEARIVELELEIEKRKSDYEALEAMFKQLEAQKRVVEDELKDLRERKDGIEAYARLEGSRVADFTQEKNDGVEQESNVFQLMAEKSVLQCEKEKVEKDVVYWKHKYSQLELRLLQLGGIGMLGGAKGRSIEETQGNNPPDTGSNFHQLPAKAKSGKLVVVGDASNTPAQGIGLPSAGVDRDVCLESAQRNWRIRKELSFEEQSPRKKIAPSTPAGAKPTSLIVIDICDSDDECASSDEQMPSLGDEEIRKLHSPCTGDALGGTLDDKVENISTNEFMGVASKQMHEQNVGAGKGDIPCVSTPKRKRAANIITSDSESDEDDDIPICKLKRMCHLLGPNHDVAASDEKSCTMTSPNPPRRRLLSLRQMEAKDEVESSSRQGGAKARYEQGIPTMYKIEDGESEQVESDSEDPSLSDFIVNDSDVSDAEDGSGQVEESDANDDSVQSEYGSDGEVEYGEILSRLRRNRDRKLKWELEGDMLADFGKDPELCMKAVCALYRRQTSDEQVSKEALHQNKRGFSKPDAPRGSKLALFLTDGDPLGDLRKTVRELQQYDTKGLESCRKLATRYSKQLFEIYKNKEDPLFLPVD